MPKTSGWTHLPSTLHTSAPPPPPPPAGQNIGGASAYPSVHQQISGKGNKRRRRPAQIFQKEEQHCNGPWTGLGPSPPRRRRRRCPLARKRGWLAYRAGPRRRSPVGDFFSSEEYRSTPVWTCPSVTPGAGFRQARAACAWGGGSAAQSKPRLANHSRGRRGRCAAPRPCPGDRDRFPPPGTPPPKSGGGAESVTGRGSSRWGQKAW